MMSDLKRALRRLAPAVLLAAVACGVDDPVVPPPIETPEAGYDLRLVGGTSHTVPLMEVLPLVVEVERHPNGYEGPVTFTAEAPPGVIVIFRPATVLVSNETDVLVVAEGSVVPRTYQVIFRGTAQGRSDRVVVLDLTLTPAP
jgi:hypothetical protein